MSNDTCEVKIVHEETVQVAREGIPALPHLNMMVEIFKALADSTRLQIAAALTKVDKMCVCDIAAMIGVSDATASHHLRYLKDRSLAKSERIGKMAYYSLADEHIHALVRTAYEHAIEEEEQ